MGAIAVLKVIDKVLGNEHVQGAISTRPAPAINGHDQRLDVLIEEVRALRASVDRGVELLAAAVQWQVEQARPAATMDLLPEAEQTQRKKR